MKFKLPLKLHITLFSFLLLLTFLSKTNAQVEKDTLLASQYLKKADSLLTNKKLNSSIEFFKKSLIQYQNAKAWEKSASCYNTISHIQKLNSDFKESLESANNALEICNQYLKKDTREEANAYDNIGHYYEQSVSDFKSAGDYFNKAFRIRRKIFPKNHEHIAVSYDKIGVLNHRQGKIDIALENYKKTLEIRIKVFGDNHLKISKSYDRMAMAYDDLGKHREAVLFFKKALDIRIQTYGKEHVQVASAYSSLANPYMYLADYKKAELYLKKALKIRIKAKAEQRESLAHLYYKLGTLYKSISKYDLSKNYYSKALELHIELFGKESIHVANTYYSLGLLYNHKGQYDAELGYLQKTLKIYLDKKRNHPNIGKIYNSIGSTLIDKGAYEKALQYLNKSLDISIKTAGENHYQTASAYYNIAQVHKSLERDDQALIFYNKSLKIDINNLGKNHPKVARSYIHLGDLSKVKKQYQEALDYYKSALNIYSNTYENNNPEIAYSLGKIGALKQEMRMYNEALHYFKKALAVREKLYNNNNKFIAESYNYIAQTYFDSGAYQNAISNYRKAQAANNQDKTNNINENSVSQNEYLDINVLLITLDGIAKTYKNIYKQNNNKNDLKNAVNTYKKVDELTNNIRSYYTNYEDKISFAKKAIEVYQGAIEAQLLLYDIEKHQKLLENTFYYFEKSKANALKELLSDTNAKNFTGLPTNLVALEKELRINHSFYQSKINEERSEQKIDSEKVTIYTNKLFDIDRKQDSLTQILEKNHPKYYELKHKNKSISIADIQKKLNKHTTVLEFFSSDSITYAFTISKNSINVQELYIPKLSENIEEFRNSITSKNTVVFKQKAHALYNKLINPIANQLVGNELIIIPDGPLWHLNFELLLTKKDESNNPVDLSFVLKKYAITYANSANLLFNPFKDEFQSKKQQECLAFSFSDSTNVVDTKTMSLATLRDTGDDLPGTRKEIRAIADIIDGEYFFGSKAVEANFKKNAKQYNILHLALHGEVDNEHPENSKLYFTKSKDTIEDNILYSHELFSLEIPAELTVLSACNTGSGKIAKGEGIRSLGTAFQYAGTKSLLLTSWEVSDQTTPELMKYFYTNLKEGMNKGKALQQAKLQYLNTANINRTHPFYWGGFYLVGDNSSIHFSDNTTLYWSIGLGVLGILVLVLLWYRKKKTSFD